MALTLWWDELSNKFFNIFFLTNLVQTLLAKKIINFLFRFAKNTPDTCQSNQCGVREWESERHQ